MWGSSSWGTPMLGFWWAEKAKEVSRAPYFMLALALIGIADAFYVAHASYTGQSMWCPIVDGCNTVAQSPYARIFGVPLSYFGLVFYLCMFGMGALLAVARLFSRESVLAGK